jgi:hypothetical protein
MTVHRVIIQIRRPSGDDPGQVSEGYYVVHDGVLTMTHEDGQPVSPDQFRHTLKAGDDPAAIAGMLTRRVRRFMLGITETEEAFNRPLGYGNLGIA